MKIKIILILLSNIITNILINYYEILLNNRNYLFELKLLTYFEENERIFAYIVNAFIIFI